MEQAHSLNEQRREAAYDGKKYDIIREGLAEILNLKDLKPAVETKSTKPIDERSQSVFYNPVQQFNRDLSVLAIKAFGEDLALIRKARHERRLEDLTKKGPKGKKRKWEDVNGSVEVEREGNQKRNTEAAKHIETTAEVAINGHESTNEPKVSSDAVITPAPESLQAKIPDGGEEQRDVSASFIEVPRGPRSLRNSNGRNNMKKNGVHEPRNGQAAESQYRESFRILDALSATGLRALRYAKETSATSITANDISLSATASIKLNVRHNDVSVKVHPITGDALAHMYQTSSMMRPMLPGGVPGKYDVIDLDPYGTAAPFLDAAVQALNDGGLLCVTCTDAGVFASTGYLEKTYSQYGGLPFKGPQSHEGGLRLIIRAIATSAARYGLAIEPLLSLSIDFYARVFVRVRRSPAEVKFLASKTMLVYNCDTGCGAWTTQFLARNKSKQDKKNETVYNFSLAQAPSTDKFCEHCGFKTHLSGPMWGGPLHNPYFVQQILDTLPSLDKQVYATVPRIEGMLSLALEETLLSPSHLPDELSELPAPDPSSNSPPLSNPHSPNQTPAPHTSPPVPPLRLNPSIPDHHPFFLILSVLSKTVHCIAPSDAQFRSALLELGYRVTRSHTKAGSIRTDAPWNVIWEVMREWVRQKAPVKQGVIKKGTAGWGIMQKSREKKSGGLSRLKEEVRGVLDKCHDDLDSARTEIQTALYRAGRMDGGAKGGNDVVEGGGGGSENAHNETRLDETNKKRDQAAAAAGRMSGRADEVLDTSKLTIVFDEKLGKESTEKKKLVRYQINPRANWGPMNKAKGSGVTPTFKTDTNTTISTTPPHPSNAAAVAG